MTRIIIEIEIKLEIKRNCNSKIDETTVLGMYTLLHWYQITAPFPPQNKMFLFSTMYSSDIYLCMHKILHN